MKLRPPTGPSTQRDPIGLAGGINQYGFASSDPINGSDPFGLKVCFDGNAAQVDSMKKATEEATATAIALDAKNCITSVTAVGGSGELSELGSRLATMAGAVDEEWSVGIWPTFNGAQPGGEAWGGRKWGRVLLGRHNQTEISTGPWGECDGNRKVIGMAGMIAHEVLGHLWRVRSGGSLRDDTAEEYSTMSENLFRSMPGKGPQRCRY